MREKIRKIFFVSSIIVTILAIACIGWYFVVQHLNKEEIEDLKDKIIVPIDKDTDKTTETNKGLRYYLIDNQTVQEQYKDLYLENNDFIGWIKINDTNIDYPVMYTNEEEQYYLRKNFYKEYSISGTIFADYYSRFSLERNSDNTILYGHSMNDGSMFQNIKKYVDEDYYKEHKYITFNTIYQNATYEVIGAYATESHNVDYEGFDVYINHINMNNELFTEYIEQCKKNTPYNIETSAEYGDELITLSTCSYHLASGRGRYVVVAKLIDSTKIDITQEPIEVINTK
ncbi:MAG: class B sortase [Bacilli bacterium]|nr:class B sortase [Bacilli bacterium]